MPTLLPPTVGERLSQCGTQVEVWGITPGAAVTLDVSGVSQTITVNATGNTFIVPGMAPNAKVRAMQKKGADQSDWSNVANAEPVALPPGPPAIEPSLPRCIQCIFAWGVAPGSKVEVLNGSVVTADGIADRGGNACMTVKQPPASTYVTQTTTCGAVSPDKGQITVVAPPDEVPAPKIVEPLFECQTVVQFQQLLPGALYEVFVTDAGGTQSSLGTFCACTPNMTVNVPHRFEPGDKVMAVGSMVNDRWQCRVRGRKSAEVPAVPPDDRIKPVIEEPVWEGDPIINVTNQIEGGTITLMRRANAQATQEDDLGSRPSSKNPEVAVGTGLRADNVIRVVQKLCNVERSSDPVTVQGIPPDIGEPAVRKPVFACADIVIVDKVIPGATVWVWQVPKGQAGPVTLLGKRKSQGSSVIVGAFPRPAQGNEVFAKQEISGKFSPPSGRLEVEFNENIPPPTVIDPVRDVDTQVWCDGLLVGAHVRLFNTKMDGINEVIVQIGGGPATDTIDAIGVWGTVPQFARITATQSLCRQGRPSAEVRVRTAQPCDGAPPYDPGKWNDGGFHEHNNRCYNYACDLQLDDTAQPGGGVSVAELQCAATSAKAASDGLIPCTSGRCHPCHHKVALVMAPGQDFHWYRLDSNGMWSHKPGTTPATNVDKSGNLISNPETANRGIYSQFCGYFCVYKPDVSI
jgi:hypothetical protein